MGENEYAVYTTYGRYYRLIHPAPKSPFPLLVPATEAAKDRCVLRQPVYRLEVAL